MLLDPQPIYKDSVKDVIADGFTTKAKVCTSADAAEGLRRQRHQLSSTPDGRGPGPHGSGPRPARTAGSLSRGRYVGTGPTVPGGRRAAPGSRSEGA